MRSARGDGRRRRNWARLPGLHPGRRRRHGQLNCGRQVWLTFPQSGISCGYLPRPRSSRRTTKWWLCRYEHRLCSSRIQPAWMQPRRGQARKLSGQDESFPVRKRDS